MFSLKFHSLMSASLNTLSGILFEDFVQPCLSKVASDYKASYIMKVQVVIIGIVCTSLVLVIEKLAPVLEVRYCNIASNNLVDLNIY